MGKSLVRALTIIYVAGILLWFGLWLLVGDRVWWTTFLNLHVPCLFVPAPLIILLTALSRQRQSIVLSFIPLLIFGMLYWPYVIPQSTQSDRMSNLQVMTYNVLYSNSDYDAVVNVILRYQPDLVALQEVQPEMMSQLSLRLERVYPYSLMGDEHIYGTPAVFSRHPIIDAYILDLEADRPAVVTKIQIDDTEITFISAHLVAYGWRWWAQLTEIPEIVRQRTHEQNRQAHLLLEAIKNQDGPVVIACDCNSKETSSSYQILTKSMTNAARATGWTIGAGALANAQQDTDLQHIDYVLYRGSLTPINVYAIQDFGGSDHLPVLALFHWN
jgi:endonuclease/exonuclease/phosphatase (EEP) superfamily protein YafD